MTGVEVGAELFKALCWYFSTWAGARNTNTHKNARQDS